MTDPITQHMPFAQLVGLEITRADKECVEAVIDVRTEICTTGHIMHGGAIMSVADTMGAVAAFLNLPDGAKATTTVESKTNFLAPAKEGTKVTAVTTPVHVGRRTSVWQTVLTNDQGKKVALVTQSQMVLT